MKKLNSILLIGFFSLLSLVIAPVHAESAFQPILSLSPIWMIILGAVLIFSSSLAEIIGFILIIIGIISLILSFA